MTGYYVYGSKRLVMTPVKKDEHHMVLSFICDFNHGDDNRTDCELIYEASHFKCAEMHLHLQVNDNVNVVNQLSQCCFYGLAIFNAKSSGVW